LNRVWPTIVLSGAGTYAMRASFLVAAHRMTHVPEWLARVLRQIPPAALAALVLPALMRPEGSFDLLQARMAAGVVAAAVAWRTRNVGLTLVVGMVVVVALQSLS
jgi:branched-subunit amino acid transport protein